MLLWGVAIWGPDFWAAPQLGYAGLTPNFWALTDTANLRKWPVTGFCDHTISPRGRCKESQIYFGRKH